jgi:uncharacterized protein
LLVLAAFLALAIGVTLGLLGGGGASLTLPMLVYALQVEPKTAIATSLLVVGATSLVGMTVHARAGFVRWKIGVTFGAAAMAGAYAGGRAAHFVPATLLLVLFGVVMVTTATLMLRGRKEDDASRPLRLPHVLALGAVVGVISGLVGAGGGFLIVPALVLFGGLPMREAIGTSLFVIGLQSFAGFAGHVKHVELDLLLVGVITAAAIVGSLAGARFASRVPAPLLRRAFAWLVLGMGMFLFAKQLPPLVAAGASALVLVVAVAVSRKARGDAVGVEPRAALPR